MRRRCFIRESSVSEIPVIRFYLPHCSLRIEIYWLSNNTGGHACIHNNALWGIFQYYFSRGLLPSSIISNNCKGNRVFTRKEISIVLYSITFYGTLTLSKIIHKLSNRSLLRNTSRSIHMNSSRGIFRILGQFHCKR